MSSHKVPVRQVFIWDRDLHYSSHYCTYTKFTDGTTLKPAFKQSKVCYPFVRDCLHREAHAKVT